MAIAEPDRGCEVRLLLLTAGGVEQLLNTRQATSSAEASRSSERSLRSTAAQCSSLTTLRSHL